MEVCSQTLLYNANYMYEMWNQAFSTEIKESEQMRKKILMLPSQDDNLEEMVDTEDGFKVEKETTNQ